MTALLDEMKSNELAERQQTTRESWQLVFDIWSNAVPTAEEGRERMENLRLTYEQIKAGCALLDRRRKWIDDLAVKQAILAQELPASEERKRLDAEFTKAKAAHEAALEPINKRIAAAEMAAREIPGLKDQLLRNLLPHVAEQKRALEIEQREAGQRAGAARTQLDHAERRERFLTANIEKIQAQIDGHKWSTPEGKQRLHDELTSAKRVFASHQQGALAVAQQKLTERESELTTIDAKLSALLTGPALALWA